MVNITPISLQLRRHLAVVGIAGLLICMAFGLCQIAGLGGLIEPALPAIFISWVVLAALALVLGIIIDNLEKKKIKQSPPAAPQLALHDSWHSRFLGFVLPPPRLAS